MDSTYENLNRTDVIDGKIVCTKIKKHEEQVVNVLKVKNAKNLSGYIKGELNVYGYSGKQVQEFIEKVYGKENVYRYSTTSGKFERLSESRKDSGHVVENNRQLNRKTIEGNDKRYNREQSKKLEYSSFLMAKIKT